MQNMMFINVMQAGSLLCCFIHVWIRLMCVLRHILKSLRKVYSLCNLLSLKEKRQVLWKDCISYYNQWSVGKANKQDTKTTSIQAYEPFTFRKSLNKHSRFFSLLRAIFCYINKKALKHVLDSQWEESSHASEIDCCCITILLLISIVIVNEIPRLSPFMALWFSLQDSFVATSVASTC